jgi:shikimate kinase
MNNNIILIGFMGVGKGTIARELAKKLDIYCVDTDDLIESLKKDSIKNIFDMFGEDYFRELEQKTAIWLENSITNSIISTGGGFYKQPNLRDIGTVIYLQSSFDGIINRLKSHKNSVAKFAKRPLLSDVQTAQKLYDSRVPSYEDIAHITINTENKNKDKITDKIIKKLKLEV